MIKIYQGIQKSYKAIYWLQDLRCIGISLQVLINPFNFNVGLSYRKGKKRMSIVWDGHIPEEIHRRVIRRFEVEEFNIPDNISKYAGLP